MQQEIENLIIGFGFSSIPLIREYENSNQEFLILSENKTAWKQLAESDRLNFDLVSSKFTSFYSFDLVAGQSEDQYPTAREFFEYQAGYEAKYRDLIKVDRVLKIENYPDHNLVYTRKQRVYRAKNVIISTGYERNITKEILEFDTDRNGQTIVFNTIGDTANMLISQLIGKNNRIIILQKGFLPLDKIAKFTNRQLTLDQFEFQNVAFRAPSVYADILTGSFGGPDLLFHTPRVRSLQDLRTLLKIDGSSHLTKLHFLLKTVRNNFYLYLARFLSSKLFQIKHGIWRDQLYENIPRTPVPNGMVALKYWPIDAYAQQFENKVDQSIARGFLLNDLPFFVEEGIVELWSAHTTALNRPAKTIQRGEQSLPYDALIEGSPESPQLEDITIVHAPTGETFQYRYRDTYLGIVPEELRNLYFMGLTRPLTGGIANINEMQSLFIHRMTTDADFADSVRETLGNRINDYNRRYSVATTPRDHIVYYGFYIEEVARALGIQLRLRDCRGFRDILHYFLFPNSTMKYRVTGKYKIENMRNLIESVYRSYENFDGLLSLLSSYFLYRVLFYGLTFKLIFAGIISPVTGLVIVVLQTFFSRLLMLLLDPPPGYFKLGFLGCWLIALPFMPPIWNLFFIAFDFASVPFIQFVLKHRSVFNDLVPKASYRKFFYERYLPALRKFQRG